MVITTSRIKYKYGQTISIRPLFDIHYGNKYCDVKALKSYLDDDSESYFIGGGDWFDAIVITDPRYSKITDATIREEIIDEQVDGLKEILSPYKERILAVGTGNHEQTISRRGTNPIRRIAKDFGVTCLGYSWLLKIILEEDVESDKSSKVRTIIIRGHHGWGGGSRTQGADLTKFSRDITYWTDANIFLYGHVHRRQSDIIESFGLSGETLVPKPKLLGICGTYLKTFTLTDEATYSEIKGYPPSKIGGLIVNIKPERRWAEYWIDT